jgi:excisionase family DNA binding protein
MARKPQVSIPAPRRDPDEKLTITEVCTELKITRSTFYDWRAKGRAPRCNKLPNGEVRIVRRDLDAWFEACRVA